MKRQVLAAAAVVFLDCSLLPRASKSLAKKTAMRPLVLLLVFAGLLVACFLALISLQAQMVIRVPEDSSTIQGAINVAMDGDTVLVAPGTYVENINFFGKAITVESEGGPEVTIINGNQNGSAVTFSSGEGTSSVLRGFTLENGRAQFEGGGISVQGSSPTIIGNTIVNNSSCDGNGIAIGFGSPIIQGNVISNNFRVGCSGGNGGGGILIRGASNAQIVDNVISDNHAGNGVGGGGISLFAAGSPNIRGNIISGNTVSTNGGGISMVNQSDALIVQNLIIGNSAFQGGGIYWLVPSGLQGPLLVNNTIANNEAQRLGSGIFAEGFDAQTKLVNNIIIAKPGQHAVFCESIRDLNPPIFEFNNVFAESGLFTTPAYGGICSDQTGINGNISEDPLFVDTVVGNFHLQPISPAIDAGDNSVSELPTMDFDGDPRILDGNSDGMAVVDIGADEFSGLTELSLSTSSLSFADQKAHTSSAAQPITVTNTGNTALHFSGVAINGDFSQTNTCRTSNGIAVGASCSISVTFTPTARGARAGMLTLTSNATNSPHEISLSGNGLAPVVNLSPTSLAFGDQLVGTTSVAQAVTLTNSGDAELIIISIDVSGDFAQTDTCGASVAVGTSCTISVTFTPSGAGTRTGTITITDDALDSPQTVALSGAATNPAPRLSSLSPSSTTAGGLGFTLTVTGSSFVSSSLVRWNGINRMTTFLSSTQLQASILASDIATAGTVEVTVFNPLPGGGASSSLTFAINATPVATNENFSDATIITTTPFSDIVDTASATTEDSDPTPSCGNSSRAKSVWYQFTPFSSGTITAGTLGSNYDTILSVWIGSPDAAFSEEACNDDASGTVQSRVSFSATAGKTYSFMVSALTNDGGSLVFNLMFRPASVIPLASFRTIIPHTAFGGGFLSRLFITSLRNNANTLTINRVDQSGTVVESTHTTLQPAATLLIADSEERRTTGSATGGWFAIGSDFPVAASVLFDFDSQPLGLTENFRTAVGTLAAQPLTAFTAPVRATTVDITVGVALANLGAGLNIINLKLLDQDGAIVAQDSVVLEAFEQTAFALQDREAFREIILGVPEFIGSLAVTTADPNQSVAAIVIGNNLGQLFALPVTPGVATTSGSNLTALSARSIVTRVPSPGSAQAIPSGNFTTIIPHSATGGGFLSRLFIVNLTGNSNNLTINRLAQNGTVVDTTDATLAPAGTVMIADDEAVRSQDLTVQWFAIGSEMPIGASLLFEFDSESLGLEENFQTAVGSLAAEPLSSFTTPLRVATVDVTAGIALANPNDASTTVNLTLINQGGTVVAQDSITLGAFEQTAFSLQDRAAFSDIILGVPEFIGALAVTTTDANLPVAALVIGNNLGQLFALPVTPGVAQ